MSASSVNAFMQLDEPTQRQALANMSPAAKGALFAAIKANAPAPPPNAGLSGPAQPNITMKTSKLPGIVRGVSQTLPAITGTVGAIVGAPAFGFGAVAGGALGAAGGEAAHLALMKSIFDNPKQGVTETSPVSGAGLRDIGIAGAIGGAAELPGAILNTAGRAIISRIAGAKSASQVGDVVSALKQASPAGLSQRGLMQDINTAATRDAALLRGELAQHSGITTNVDSVLANARTQAMANNAQLPGTAARFERLISAAKIRSGITGPNASPQQLFDFAQQLQNPAFHGTGTPVSGVVKDLAKQAYRDVGGQIRVIAPTTDPVFTRLTNYHAAESALKGYRPGTAASIAVSAATHPRTTAALSPAIGAAAYAGPSVLSDALKNAPIQPFVK